MSELVKKIWSGSIVECGEPVRDELVDLFVRYGINGTVQFKEDGRGDHQLWATFATAADRGRFDAAELAEDQLEDAEMLAQAEIDDARERAEAAVNPEKAAQLARRQQSYDDAVRKMMAKERAAGERPPPSPEKDNEPGLN